MPVLNCIIRVSSLIWLLEDVISLRVFVAVLGRRASIRQTTNKRLRDAACGLASLLFRVAESRTLFVLRQHTVRQQSAWLNVFFLRSLSQRDRPSAEAAPECVSKVETAAPPACSWSAPAASRASARPGEGSSPNVSARARFSYSVRFSRPCAKLQGRERA